MANIKIFDRTLGKWRVLASGKATGISTSNPIVLRNGEEVISVDTALARLYEKSVTYDGYFAWLAINGGGGAGTGGGGSSVTEATCNIQVISADGTLVDSGGAVVLGDSGLQVSLHNIDVKTPKNWTVTIRIGSSLVATRSASYATPTFFVDKETIAKFLTNHSGILSISASYEDDILGVYGSASWSGSIVEAVVNISCENVSVTQDNIRSAQVVYNYSAGYLGDTTQDNYRLNYRVKNSSGTVVKEGSSNLRIISTSQQSRALDIVGDIFTESEIMTGDTINSDYIGVFTIEASLTAISNSAITASTVSNLTIASDNILIATTTMSNQSDSPVEVSLDGVINLDFTAYVSGGTTFHWKLSAGSTIIAQDNGTFGTRITRPISVNGASWATLDATVGLLLEVTSGSKRAVETYYVKFVSAANNVLSYNNVMNSHYLTNFLGDTSPATGVSSFEYTNSTYINGGSQFVLTSKIQPINGNSLSVLTAASTGERFLRISNGAAFKATSWTYDNKQVTFPGFFPQNSQTKEFTMHLCFKADYHADDDRTLLFCGKVDVNTGKMMSGISINVHDIYINNESVYKLTDNVVNDVDITCMQTIAGVPDPVTGQIHKAVSYIVKVYLDGVLTAIRRLSDFPTFSSDIYLGCRARMVGTSTEYYNYCDCNIYSFSVFDTALSDYDIMLQHINMQLYTHYLNGAKNYNLISSELKKNFCTRNADGSVHSNLYQVDANGGPGDYTIGFLLNAQSQLDQQQLNDNAAALGLPVVLIDVSSDPNWTFNAFIAQQTAGAVSLPASEGRLVQYWDPNGGNTNIQNINNCIIELQGTSTLADAVKNINITVPDTTAFIPKETWFPEQTYTLKADVVDSSHSCNAAIGNFINTEFGEGDSAGMSLLPFDSTALKNVQESEYRKTQQKEVTLKHTVEGFPALVIMKFYTDENNTIAVTALGIYSFNLGRNAYRNLGFKKLNAIVDSDGVKLPEITAYPFLAERIQFQEEDSDANWIEIKDTSSVANLIDFTDKIPEPTDENGNPRAFDSSVGDFWQDDDKILDYRYEVRYPAGMSTHQYSNFKTFVRNIMLLPLEGTYSTDSVGNITKPRVSGSFDLYTMDDNNNYIPLGTKLEMATDANTFPKLGFNIQSAIGYFTIGNLFGLVDNFGKNSTYRSWHGGDYFVDFYDLDCALGGANQGELDVTPDLWMKYLYNKPDGDKGYGYLAETYNSQIGISHKTMSANHNKLWMSLDTDFSRSVFGGNYGNTSSAYTQCWYAVRAYLQGKAANAGYYLDADKKIGDIVSYFMNEYFIKQTGQCGSLVFNYDYKLKYLLQFTGNEYNNTKDLTKLHGRKIAYTRDWFKKHILFLDSLFYWRDSQQTLNFANNVNTRGANTVLNTVAKFPITTNTPLVMFHNVGNTTQTYYFMQQNTPTFVNAGNNASDSVLNWNMSNSPNIIEFGDDECKLKDMNVRTLSMLPTKPSDTTWDTVGYPAITMLDLSQNDSFYNFSLDAFRAGFDQGVISEIRELDFSNTSSSSGSSFRLDLAVRTSDGSFITPFRKLTKVNISNSTCITSIDIPAIPLKELNVSYSSITDFTLIDQAYLKEVDLTGCTRITTINITNCASYEKLEISGLNNLTSVNVSSCASIKKVEISNCQNLRNLNIQYCDNLEEIRITKCAGLTNDVVITNCNGLKTLSLSGCSNLEHFTLDVANQANITTLNLSSTRVKYIKGNNTNTGLLDLSAFGSLSSFAITSNPDVEKIQFANNQGRAIPLRSRFTNCNSLQRIYGHVSLQNTELFNGCYNFSIHGADIYSVTFLGRSVIQGGIVLMPYEVERGKTGSGPSSNYTVGFQTGLSVTNMDVDTTSLDKEFALTNCTTFDIYYIFSKAQNVTNFSEAFMGLKQNPFYWIPGTDNSPHRYMLYFADKASDFYSCFRAISSQSGRPLYIRLFSPTVTDGVVTADDGFFSPVRDTMKSVFRMFEGYNFVIDKYLFRCTEGNKYVLTNMAWFRPAVLINNISSRVYLNVNDSSSVISSGVTLEDVGDFTDFFADVPNLSAVYYSFYEMRYINYDTIRNIPAGCKAIAACFTASRGAGTLIPKLFFADPSKVTIIDMSFRVSGVTNGITSKVDFPITDSVFADFTSLTSIGYDVYGTYTSAKKSPFNNCSFGGAGVHKYIAQAEFPMEILNSCKKTIQYFTGFFEDCEQGDLIGTPALPGTLLRDTPNMVNVNLLFYNTKFAYSLVGGGLTESTRIASVAYMFAASTNSENKLTGSIPMRLLYHGQRQATLSYNGIVGTVTRTTGVDENKLPYTEYTIVTNGKIYVMRKTGTTITWKDSGGNEVQPTDVYSTVNVTFNDVNRSITDASGLFQNANISPFTNNSPETEPNREYQPFTHIYRNGVWYPVTQNTHQTTLLWSYDGVSKGAAGAEYPDEQNDGTSYSYYDVGSNTERSCTLNYCTAPDLLRYCAVGCAIRNLFNGCGHNVPSSIYGNLWSSNKDYGLKGRIPPHLLYPMKNENTAIDISGMFQHCTQLSYYKNSGRSYIIPETFFKYCPNIINMEWTFAGLTFPYDIDLNVFAPINSKMCKSINHIFYKPYFYTKTGQRAAVSNVFLTLKDLSNAAWAFAATYNNSNEEIKYTNQSVTFNSVFPVGVYNKSSYDTNENFSYAFAYYGTGNSAGNTIHENPKTLVDNTTTNNYEYYG